MIKNSTGKLGWKLGGVGPTSRESTDQLKWAIEASSRRKQNQNLKQNQLAMAAGLLGCFLLPKCPQSPSGAAAAMLMIICRQRKNITSLLQEMIQSDELNF